MAVIHTLYEISFSSTDKSTPYTKSRWVGAFLNIALFLTRIVIAQGWYIVTYALGIYHLNLFIAFLTPKIDPSLDLDSGEYLSSDGECFKDKAMTHVEYIYL